VWIIQCGALQQTVYRRKIPPIDQLKCSTGPQQETLAVPRFQGHAANIYTYYY